MAGQLLNTSGSRMLRTQYREITPRPAYRAPLDNLRVVEPRAPRIDEDRFPARERSWKPLAWMLDAPLEIPKSVVAAVEHYLDVRYGESFQVPAEVAKLNLPSLVAEARQEWRREHGSRRRAALQAVGDALLACGPTLYEQCAKGLAKAIGKRDDAAYKHWSQTAGKIRSLGVIGHIEGDGGKPKPVKLSSGAVEWLVARPDVLHDLDVRLSASVCADHPELEPGCYTPTEVVEHLAALGYR